MATSVIAQAGDWTNVTVPNPIHVSMAASSNIDKLIEALSAAQLEFLPLKKTKKNPYYGNMYADLQDVISATLPSLAKHGLVIIQLPETDLDKKTVTLVSKLAHKSGQYLENRLTLPGTMKAKDGAIKFDQQSCIAATTYARRLSWQSLVGVAGDEDDDGNSLGTDQPQTPKKPKYEPKPGKIDKIEVTGEQKYDFTPEGPKLRPETGLPKASIPPAPAVYSVGVPELSQEEFPTKEEMKEFVRRSRVFTREILPKLEVEDPSGALLNYIQKKTGISETKHLTKNQWESILSGLDKHYSEGNLKDVVLQLGLFA